MKYFTKEWYRAALAEEQQRAAGGKLKFNKKPDNAMRDYQRALSKIQSKLPACVCKTFHGSVITDVAARQDQVVLYFDNSESFSDVEKLVLYDADITCSEGDPVGKTWLHEEVSLADGAFAWRHCWGRSGRAVRICRSLYPCGVRGHGLYGQYRGRYGGDFGEHYRSLRRGSGAGL